jgi:hypothetical protein
MCNVCILWIDVRLSVAEMRQSTVDLVVYLFLCLDVPNQITLFLSFHFFFFGFWFNMALLDLSGHLNLSPFAFYINFFKIVFIHFCIQVSFAI